MNEQIRQLFPGASERTYLNMAAKGLVPTTVRDVVHEYVNAQVAGTSDKDVLREGVEETRALVASMIGADADEAVSYTHLRAHET